MANYTIEHITQFNAEHISPIADMLAQLTGRDCPFGENELRALTDNPASQLFLLHADSEVIGMLTLGRYASPTGVKVWIEDVIVKGEYRGQGLGRRLVDHAIEYCNANFAPCTLMLTSNPARVAANELYRTSGFEPKQTNVYKMNFR